jgi:hypothetical protein
LKDNDGMQLRLKCASRQRLRLDLLTLGTVALLTGGAVQAQNLDEGKSAAKLFADGCSPCHRSPRGLAKGRISLTLFLFLQQHYSTSSSSARALTSYLESVDDTGHGPSRPKAAKRSQSAPRPPAPVLGHQ